MTTTTLARGYTLSRQNIADGWVGYTNTPELTGHPRYGALIEALVDATEKAGDALLPEGVVWLPNISEIIGEVGTELPDITDGDEDDYARAFAERAADAVDYDAVEAEVFGDDQAEDAGLYVTIVLADNPADTFDHGPRTIWQAVTPPEPVAETGFTGTVYEIADAVAADYAAAQEQEAAEQGGHFTGRVQATISRRTSDGEHETVATSAVHTAAKA